MILAVYLGLEVERLQGGHVLKSREDVEGPEEEPGADLVEREVREGRHYFLQQR